MLEDETGDLEIGALDDADMAQAVEVIVRGMRDNPNVVAALGQHPGVRHRRLLRLFGAMAAAEVPVRNRDMLAARAGWFYRGGLRDGAAGPVPAGPRATVPPHAHRARPRP